MALTLANYPNFVEFTRNPIVFAYETDNYSEYDARMYLKIEVDRGGGFESIAELEKRPDPDHLYVFDISEILDQVIREVDLLLPAARNYDAALVYATKHQIRYKISVEEHYGDPDTKDDSPDPVEGLAVKGGLSHELYPELDPYFSSYLASKKQFLTWLPKRMTISRWTPVTLFLFNYSGSDWTNLEIEFVCTFQDPIDNSLSTVTSNKTGHSLAANKILIIPADPSAADLFDLASDKNLVSYSVTAIDSSSIVSESKIFELDPIYRLTEKTFAYLNSCGGIDHIRCTGLWDPKGDYSSGNFEKSRILDLKNPRATYNGLEHLKNEFAISESMGFKVNSGPKTLEEIHCFRDFRLSPWKAEFLPFANIYVPIVIDSKSIDFPKSNQSPLSFEFTYKYAFENRNFSPHSVMFK